MKKIKKGFADFSKTFEKAVWEKVEILSKQIKKYDTDDKYVSFLVKRKTGEIIERTNVFEVD